MSLHVESPHDLPLRPPEPEAESGVWRWLVAAVLVLVIVVGAYQAYRWLVTDVERRRAVAEAPTAYRAHAATVESGAAPALVNRTVGPTQSSAAPYEAQAPAVTGQTIHKCVADGQVTYSNQPCPPDASDAPPAVADTDPNGVAGSAGGSVPALAVRPAGLDIGNPGQHSAVCGYLAAEIERLDFEFNQPLPPAVLDHISSQLAALRAQHDAVKCASPVKAAPATPARKRRSAA